MERGNAAVRLGAVVVIRGLERAVELNGRYGKVVGMRGGRLLVDIEGSGDVKAVKVENCKLPRPVRAWCHPCGSTIAAKYTETGELSCTRCGTTFVEAAITDEQLRDASQFPASRLDPAEHVSMDVDAENHAARDPIESIFSSFLAPRRQVVFRRGGVVGVMAPYPFLFSGDHVSFDNILHTLHQQAEPRGPPPASRDAVDRLERFVTDATHAEHECTVCQDSFAEGESAVKMPCGHVFHADCLTPWLKEHNTCPTCRHELPTDDDEYEARKVQEAQSQVQRHQQESDATLYARDARHA